jgi:hypothetical protein
MADPYEASGRSGEPGSWNRYPYVGGDPVNKLDPRGLWFEWASLMAFESDLWGGSAVVVLVRGWICGGCSLGNPSLFLPCRIHCRHPLLRLVRNC